MRKLYKRIFIYLTVITILTVFITMGLAMSGKNMQPHTGNMAYFLKNILGFPLVLINKDYPFYLDCMKDCSFIKIICLSFLNIAILSLLLTGLVYLIRKINKGI